MKKFHEWNVTPKQAIEIQNSLRKEIILEPLQKPIQYIAGADISLNLYSTTAYAGIIVLKFPELVPVEHALVKTEIRFPYIPGFLSFREIPALMQALEKLKNKPDVTVVDGQGIAHPRRLGIATHFGILADTPTIGCAKNILFGDHTTLADEQGSEVYLQDSATQEYIGVLLRSKRRSKPLVISPGYKIALQESVDIMKKCIQGYRIPEPTRQAHLLVNAFRRGEVSE